MPQKIVFYSWQSDLPNSSNRGFIQQALERAAAEITADDTVDVEPVIDRDTMGVPGAPDIASTIFSKITAADIFVADISIINQGTSERPTPNPNVLLELGYAFKTLGQERIILVFNKAFGQPQELPFDLRMKRFTTYNMPETESDRATERDALQQKLSAGIRSALQHVPADLSTSSSIPALAAIENQQVNRVPILRRNLISIYDKLE